jgi:colanic acid/amylovoran biosynthesis glycosyltransferase
MRIAYLVSQYPAASHTFIRREIAALRARGATIETFSIREPSPNERVAAVDREEYDRTFYVLPIDWPLLITSHTSALATKPIKYLKTLKLALGHRVPGVKAFVWALAHFAESIIIAQELDKRDIEHVHNHFANSGANVGFLATRFLGLPWSMSLHGISETDYPAGNLLPAKLREANFAVCISHYTKSQAMRVVEPEHWKKFVLVHCGIDLSVLPTRTPSAGRSRLRIICVGRLAPEKGTHGLIEAFAMLRARGDDAELVLVGDGPDKASLEHEIKAQGLESSVTMLGRLAEPDTLAQIAQSDVLVLASFMEGLPVVLMEAMALGLPVIAPRVAGVPELVEDGVHGYLFAPSAWQELADCMHRMMDPAARARLCQNNRAKVEAEFEINTAVAPLEQRFGVANGAPSKAGRDGAVSVARERSRPLES